MALPDNPNNRKERYLAAIAGQAVEVPAKPITREEAYLDYIATHGGGGGGGDVTGVKGSAESTYRKGNVNITPANLGLPSDAAANIIEKIIVNGTEVEPVNKAVSLTLLTKAVNDLANYYLKSETYTKAEVDTIIGNLSHLTLEIVASLPTQDISTTTIYLVPVSGQTNVYMQYAYINSTWAQLGITQIDLSNYYTKTEVDTLLSAKQDSLIFDSTPTASSTNPVTSGGVYNALAGKQDSLTIDSVVTEDSGNPVSSGAVFDALENMPTDSITDGEMRPITSNAVYDAMKTETVNVGTVTATSGETANLIIIKSGKVVQLKLDSLTTTGDKHDIVFSGVIPVGYRPAGSVIGYGKYVGYSIMNDAGANILINGSITLYNYSQFSNGTIFATYITA